MNLSIIGLQWGDEGKGKIIDLLSNYSELNIRYNGGHNAGHIIYIKNIKKNIRILPSGIFKKNCLCLISNNVLLSLFNLLKELKNIKNNLIISENVFIVNKIDEFIDYLIDKIINIGTTFSGISICYLRKYLKCCLSIRNVFFINYYNLVKKIIFFYNLFFIFFKIKLKIIFLNFSINIKKLIFFFKKKIVKNNIFINNKNNKIFESSQGALLDFDLGTYPFVTCSSTINKSIFINSNFFLKKIKFIGIIKSYITRVGNGFLLSKIKKFKNNLFSILTKEFGTNSLRLRKSGWLDLICLINMIKINNISNIILTKMDSFIFIKYLKIIINYKSSNIFLNHKNNFFCKENYIKFFSWKTVNYKYNLNEKNFHLYVRFIEKSINTPISIISIGKRIKDIIIL
ncbi:adenylosuccinate synthetase [Candidatus Carsonella ruddii]|uniref:Adenylosuccinate synthetase n=1 Tax=Carsonella ruddii TaxID=114186 RepID=A0A1U9RRB9_CARRU|nr:adenylosuccinate synthetase [Candidatus Carsonella ruddii]AQU89454.1 Adenylosuccinate synthetase [Candidatus Carsonella ruddii]